MAPPLKLVSLQDDITTSEFKNTQPEVIMWSLPLKSHLTKLTRVPGMLTNIGIFYFKFLGIDLKESTQSLKIRPPFDTMITVSMFLDTSNSLTALTLAFF